MPTAVKHQRELGDDIQVIFVECQGADRDTYEAFAWKMKWMGNQAMWTEERPLPTTGSGLPETALIGVDGSVIMQGHPGALGKKLTEAIEAEIKKSKQPPEGSPAELKKAWTAFLKGDVSGAIAECDKLGGDDAEAAKSEFLSRTSARLERAQRLIDEGYLHAAEELVSELEKGLKGHEELSAKLGELSSKISDPAMQRELEAAKALDKLFDKIATDKPFDAGNVKKVQSLADKYEGTKAAARAAHFIELSKMK